MANHTIPPLSLKVGTRIRNRQTGRVATVKELVKVGAKIQYDADPRVFTVKAERLRPKFNGFDLA